VKTPSIYQAAGGAPAFLALAAAHHQRCLEDPVLEHPFSHGTRSDHVERLAGYWGEVFGGPAVFSQTAGGHVSMLAQHAGMDPQDDLGALFLACFLHAIDDAGLPEDPRLRAALRSYMEWATAEVMSYSPAGSAVPPDLIMPHWSWDGLQTADSGAV
jgi:hemoglobin